LLAAPPRWKEVGDDYGCKGKGRVPEKWHFLLAVPEEGTKWPCHLGLDPAAPLCGTVRNVNSQNMTMPLILAFTLSFQPSSFGISISSAPSVPPVQNPCPHSAFSIYHLSFIIFF
jgi:hypothetical protein